MLDSLLVANEVLDDARRRKKHSLIFKVDFGKAYNCVNCEFLFYMRRMMCFDDK